MHNSLGSIFEKQGRLEEAAAGFARAAALRPGAIGLLLSLAFVQRKLARYGEAVMTGERALALDPRSVDALNSLGVSLKNAGHNDAALDCFRRAIELRPVNPQVHLGYANVLYELKRFDDAVVAYRRAIELKPDYGEAHGNLGVVLQALERYGEAQDSFKRALELIGDSPELLTTYGLTLQAVERYDDAIVQHRKALALKPDFPSAYNNLGISLAALNRRDEALAAYRRALEIRPDYPEALNNLANLLKELSRPDEARAAYNRALEIRPNFHEAELNRANIDYGMGDIKKAIGAYREILAKAPAMVDTHFNLALALLTLGEFAEGWEEHEWRWQRPGVKPHGFKQPMWHQAAPRGARVLVHSEQSFGDAIQMARYVPRIVALGHRVKIGAPKPLRRWLATLPEVEVIQTVERHNEVDFQIPFLSLPRTFGTRLETIPAEVPYLPVPLEEAARFRKKLGDGFKVGLVWRGSKIHKNDRNRSIDPRLLAPLFGIEAVRIVSLQKEPRPGDLAVMRDLGPFIDLTAEFSDFAATAAFVETLDLVVAVDTSVAHVAGALGKPLFLMLPFVPDWRWLLDRDDSPWYPSARLFRQTQIGDWSDVIERVAAALRERVAR